MSTQTIVVPEEEEGKSWRRCPSRGCGASFDIRPDDFIISGDGNWSNTIVCKRCMHVREKVPDEVLAGLLAEKYGSLASHCTYDHCLHFIETRRRWWLAKTAVEERLD